MEKINRKKILRITSSKGKASDTTISYQGKPLSHTTSLDVKIRAGEVIAASIEVIMPGMDISVLPENVQIVLKALQADGAKVVDGDGKAVDLQQ